ncbi:MAG TPA: DUF2752 domain-containing protein [Planctomycetes bacterium]|nr:DUF2752 domain-containing protein [Planctomycetota bacterium]
MKIDVVQVSRRPQWPLWAVILVLVWLAIAGAAVYLSLHLDQVVSLCLFKRLTHVPCPTCGFTRGVLCMLSGRLSRAWRYNPLLFSVLALFIAVTGIRIIFARGLRIRLTRIERIIAWLSAAGLLAANWVYVIFYVH